MYFRLFKFIPKVLTLSISIILFSSNLYSFEKIINTIYDSDKELLRLQKKLSTIKADGLQAALRDKENTQESLTYSIALRKDYLLLQTLFFNLKKSQKQKEIALISETNKKLFQLYDEQILPHISEYDKKILRGITQDLSKARLLLKEHKNELNRVNKRYKHLSNQSADSLNINEIIETTPLIYNAKKGFSIFSKKEQFEKEIILRTLGISNSQVENFLNNAYHSYLNLLKRFQSNTKQILELSSKNIEKKSPSKQLSHSVSLLQARLKQESIRLKILLEKSSIFYVTGTIKPLLSSKKTLANTPKLPEKKKDIQKISNLKRIHFVGNSSKVTSYSFPIVKSHAKRLQKKKNFILELHGHSDNKGDKKKNYQLSQMRVKEVKKILVDFGVQKEKIKTFAHGDSSPIATNKTKKGRLLNRRVEFKIIEEK